jgi:hypothetical protein
VTKGEIACTALLDAIYEDAFDICEQIIESLREAGIAPSLSDLVCRNAFAIDWFVSRLAFLQVSSDRIRDSELRDQFRREVGVRLEGVSKLIYDARACFDEHCMLASMFLAGDRDSSGLLPGPGPFLATRYSRHVENIKRDGLSSWAGICVPDEESLAISILGDRMCWALNGTLNDVLTSIMNV